MTDFFDIIGDITIYVAMFLPILFLKGFVRNNKAFQYFACYLILVGVIQFLMWMHREIYVGESTLYFFIYYFVLQFVLLSLFYKQLLGFRSIFLLTGITLVFIAYQYVADPEMYFRYNPIGSTITQIIIVLYSLLYFYKSLSGKKEFLIINFGVFFYFLSSILIFASGNLALNKSIPESISHILDNANLILYFVFQILIIVEWYRNYRVKFL